MGMAESYLIGSSCITICFLMVIFLNDVVIELNCIVFISIALFARVLNLLLIGCNPI